MSGFSSIANGNGAACATGGLPSSLPHSIFRSSAERAAYESIISGSSEKEFRIKRVKVEIFDLSDPRQVRKYEKLWKGLLERSSRMEVIVDSHKDLVKRPDGSSYWMKYVEYVEFGKLN